MSDDQQNRPADDGFTPTPDGTETPAPAPDPWARTQFSPALSNPAPSNPAPSDPTPSDPTQPDPSAGQNPFAPPAADPAYGTPPAYGAPPVHGAPAGYGAAGGYGTPGDYPLPAPQGGPGGFQPPVYGAPGGFDPAGYPPPGGYQQQAVPQSKPGTVIASMVMQMIGGALTILMGILVIIVGVMWETSEELRNSQVVQDALADANLTSDDLSTVMAAMVIVGVIFIAFGAFLVYLGYASGQGKNWARITATVLWVIAGLFFITAYLPTIWAIVIIVLLWLPASNAFFSRQPS